jgi:acyl-coenzyme A synthetase/AMP-(fatty) acid ligase
MATITSEHASTWPCQSKKLLNHAVDDLARERPGALYAELPVSPVSFDKGFRRVTYRDFSNAINGMAWWLARSLGVGKDFETLVYVGPNDMRHNILLLGAVKAGYKVS